MKLPLEMFIYLLNEIFRKALKTKRTEQLSDSGWWDEIGEDFGGPLASGVDFCERNKQRTWVNKIFGWNIIRKQILPG